MGPKKSISGCVLQIGVTFVLLSSIIVIYISFFLGLMSKVAFLSLLQWVAEREGEGRERMVN